MEGTGAVYADPGSVCAKSVARVSSDHFGVQANAWAERWPIGLHFGISTTRSVDTRLPCSIKCIYLPEHSAPSRSVQHFLESCARSDRYKSSPPYDQFLTILSKFELLTCDSPP